MPAISTSLFNHSEREDGSVFHLGAAVTPLPAVSSVGTAQIAVEAILLPQSVVTALRAVKPKNPKYFFWSGHSKVQPAASVWRKRIADVFETAKSENGHTHRFRDTFAVGLLEKGVSPETVSILLGHQNIKISQKHYAPWVKTRQDALEKEVLGVLTA